MLDQGFRLARRTRAHPKPPMAACAEQAQAGRQLPVEEMSHLVAAVRRATRVLWGLHITLQQVSALSRTQTCTP